MTNQPGIVLDHVHWVVGKRTLVDDVSVHIKPGRMTAMMGPNGAGKTSILRLIAGLQSPTRGDVRFDGVSSNRWSPSKMAKQRSFMGQSTTQSFEFSVLEYVLLGLHNQLSKWRLPNDEHVALAVEALKCVELDTLQSQSMTHLSAGESQRMQLARLLVQRSPWWMMDEPLSNLDLKHQRLAMGLVREHCALQTGGAIIILHDLNQVYEHADDVLLMDNGRIIGHGPVEEICTQESLSDLFGVRLVQYQSEHRTWWGIED